MATTRIDTISALILAGGRARRMNGEDKGLVEINGQPMISHVIASLSRQLSVIRINANRSIEAYRRYGHEVLSDELADYQGPLAGMARGLAGCPTPLMLVVPCDSPCLPDDLALRLHRPLVAEAGDIAVAHDGQRMQPVVALMKRELYPSLQAFLDSGERKIDLWYRKHQLVTADFSDVSDAFVNVNTPDECASLERKLRA